jgi:hypothetical protein
VLPKIPYATKSLLIKSSHPYRPWPQAISLFSMPAGKQRESKKHDCQDVDKTFQNPIGERWRKKCLTQVQE